MAIEIEKNVSVPLGKRTSKYPWKDMEPGDSFFVEVRPPNRLLSAALGWVKRNDLNWKFKTRKEGNGTRIWREE